MPTNGLTMRFIHGTLLFLKVAQKWAKVAKTHFFDDKTP